MSDKFDWFLIQFKPNSHRLAERNLGRQGFHTFLPMQKVTSRKATKFVDASRPLFPGYFFVGCDGASMPWRKINSTVGVAKLVSFAGKPSQIPNDLVDALKLRCDETGELKPPQVFKPGDDVILTAGPFADFAATVETMAADQRVWVLLDLMGQKSRVQVNASDLVA